MWKVLGIARTRDRGEIRRAYAAKLKKTNPEDDAEGFQRLRAAYDSALRYADRGVEPYAFALGDDEDEPAGVEFADIGGFEVHPVAEDAEPLRDYRRRQRADRPEPSPDRPDASASDRGRAEAEMRREARDRNARFNDARARLTALVRSRTAPSRDEIVAALSEVLESEAMEDVGLFSETEAWLAELIAWNFPRTDPMIDPAAERFGWRTRIRTLSATVEMERILQREFDLRYLAQLRSRRHPQHENYERLRKGPSGSPWGRLQTLWRSKAVRDLLVSIQLRHPTLSNDFDDAILAAWDEYFARPRVGPGEVLASILVPAFVAIVAFASGENVAIGGTRALIAFGVTFATLAGGLATKLYALDRLRRRWLETWTWGAPDWIRGGWASLACATLLLAGALPAHPVVTALAAFLSGGILTWAFTVAAEDDVATGSQWSGRFLRDSGVVAFCWFLMLVGQDKARMWEASGPFLAAVIAFTRSQAALNDAFEAALSRRTKLWTLAVGGGLSLAAVATWIGSGVAGWTPPFALAAASAALVFAQRAPRRPVGPNLTLRYYLSTAGAAAAFVTCAVLETNQTVIGGAVVATLAAVGFIAAFVERLRERG